MIRELTKQEKEVFTGMLNDPAFQAIELRLMQCLRVDDVKSPTAITNLVAVAAAAARSINLPESDYLSLANFIWEVTQ